MAFDSKCFLGFLITVLVIFYATPNFGQFETDPPHEGEGFGCFSCHAGHQKPGVQITNLKGNANSCMSCHNPAGLADTLTFAEADRAIPGESGTSHAWNVPAANPMYGAELPQEQKTLQRVYDGQIVCSTCHDQHLQTYPPFLRQSNTGNALCKDCHTSRDVGSFRTSPANKGSHPVGVNYPTSGESYFSEPQNPDLLLAESGRIECTTCHSVHYADSGGANSGDGDGYILRTKNDDSLCNSCHTYPDHMGQSCLSCHQPHDPNQQNIFLVRENVVTPNSQNKTVAFLAETSENSFADGDGTFDGICEVCHTTTNYHRNNSSGGHGHFKGENCTTCHSHANAFTPTGGGHPEGWRNPTSPEFHGLAIRNSGWNLQQCKTCHGDDYSGGTSKVSCLTCHPATPEDCVVCHGGIDNRTGAPPEDIDGNRNTSAAGVGAHTIHLEGGDLSSGFDCEVCHNVPASFDVNGHVDSDLPAELNFNGLALNDGANPSWDNQTCQNVYCHGDFTLGNVANAPDWTTVGGTQAACSSCHGLPPGGNHPTNDACSTCHPTVVDNNMNIINKTLHINGSTEVTQDNCDGCHNQSPPLGSSDSRRRQIVGSGGDFIRTSHHVTNVTNDDCKICHDQSKHTTFGDGLTVFLNDPDGGAAFTYNGNPASADNFCINCHDGDNPSPFPSEGTNPQDIASNWDNSSHNQSGENCLDCHAQGHGADFPSILDNNIVGETVSNSEEEVCYACHDSNGSASDIKAKFARNHRHNISDSDQTDGSKLECTNCHNPHAGNSSNPLIGPDNKNSVWTGTGSAFCLKCHDGGAPSGVTFPANTNGTGFNKSNFIRTTHDQRLGDDSCQQCHHPHGSNFTALLKAEYVTSEFNNYQSGDYQACWNCHSENQFRNKNTDIGDLHEEHVEENITCIACHDVHGPYDSGETLISFKFALDHGFDFQLIDGKNLSSAYWIDGNEGFCYLKCHGEEHDPESYSRVGSRNGK